MSVSASPSEPCADDRTLVADLLAGDEVAFEALWRHYYPRVFHFSCSILKHDRDLAEDVTQEVFMHCFEKLAQFRFESRLSTWMMSIAYRKCLRAMRNAKRLVSLNEEMNEGEPGEFQDLLADLRASPQEETMWREVLGIYRWALTQLKESQRSAWVLHREQGMPHEEIAGVIGKTPNSCRILVARARVRLMEVMGVDALKDICP